MKDRNIEKDIYELLKELKTQKANHNNCSTHHEMVNDFKESISNLSQEIFNLKQEINSRNADIDFLNEILKKIHHKLFVSNGEISMTENIRNIQGSLNRHIQNHNKIQVPAKIVLGVMVSIIIALMSLVLSFIHDDPNTHIDKDKLKQVQQVMLDNIVK